MFNNGYIRNSEPYPANTITKKNSNKNKLRDNFNNTKELYFIYFLRPNLHGESTDQTLFFKSPILTLCASRHFDYYLFFMCLNGMPGKVASHVT